MNRTKRTRRQIITALLQCLEQKLKFAKIGTEHDAIIRLMGILALKLFREEQGDKYETERQ